MYFLFKFKIPQVLQLCILYFLDFSLFYIGGRGTKKYQDQPRPTTGPPHSAFNISVCHNISDLGLPFRGNIFRPVKIIFSASQKSKSKVRVSCGLKHESSISTMLIFPCCQSLRSKLQQNAIIFSIPLFDIIIE